MILPWITKHNGKRITFKQWKLLFKHWAQIGKATGEYFYNHLSSGAKIEQVSKRFTDKYGGLPFSSKQQKFMELTWKLLKWKK